MEKLSFRDLAAIQIAAAFARSRTSLPHNEVAEQAYEFAAALEEQRHRWQRLDEDLGDELPLDRSEDRISEIRRRRAEA